MTLKLTINWIEDGAGVDHDAAAADDGNDDDDMDCHNTFIS